MIAQCILPIEGSHSSDSSKVGSAHQVRGGSTYSSSD